MRLLKRDASNRILPLNEDTFNNLLLKHPEDQQVHEEMLPDGSVEKVSNAIFDKITSDSILKAALKTKGSAKPLMYDADDWRSSWGLPFLVQMQRIFGKDLLS